MVGSGLPAGSSGDAPRAEGIDEPMGTAAEDADVRRGLKRSAELPLDDRPRDRAPRRGEDLDDDAPIVTPIVLTGAEIWTLARTTIALFGASVSKLATKLTSYSIVSSLIIDLTAKRDDGQFWDFGTRERTKRDRSNCGKNTKQNS